MLHDAHPYAKLPAKDPERAKRFYVEVLGLHLGSERAGHMYFEHADGSTILVFPSSGTPAGDHDQCGWMVDDFDAEVAELRRRGVVFEEFPGGTYEDGVLVSGYYKGAWFHDTEGNLLNVRSRAPRVGEERA